LASSAAAAFSPQHNRSHDRSRELAVSDATTGDADGDAADTACTLSILQIRLIRVCRRTFAASGRGDAVARSNPIEEE
jgi:hypothetical protein